MSTQPFYHSKIEDETLANENYRKVVYTGTMQLVFMKLLPGEEIGAEVHNDRDQFFRIEQGIATAMLDGKEVTIQEDEVLIVPAGTNHNIINRGERDLKVYTIYAPAEHPADREQLTKPE